MLLVPGLLARRGSVRRPRGAASHSYCCVGAELMSLFRVGFSQHGRVLGRA